MKLNLLNVVAAVLSTSWKPVTFDKLQEIVSAKILKPADGADPFLVHSGKEVYVTFTHDVEKGQESLPFEPVNHGDAQLFSRVNLHIRLDDKTPLKCEIYERTKHSRGKKIGFVEFSAKDLDTEDKEAQLIASIRDVTGKETKTSLVLDTVQQNWNEAYKVNVEKPGKVELFFQAAANVLNEAVKKTKNPKANELLPPQRDADPALPMLEFLDGTLKFPEDGEFASVSSLTKWKMALMNKLPFSDHNTPYHNRAEAVFEVRKILKDILPTPPEGRWVTPNRDANMKRVFFGSLGMYLVEKNRENADAGYVSDTTYLADYKYRGEGTNGAENKYEPYGCKTYFDAYGNLKRIEDKDGIYRPGDEHWEWAKLKSRTSAFVMASLLHVVHVHYIWGNVPGTAMRKFLSKNHKVRRAFSPHFYKTAYTCTRARYSLFDRRGILLRGLSMAYEGGLEQIFIDLLENFRFSRYPDELKSKGLDKCKFHVGATDGMDLHNCLSDYVSEFLDEVYEGNQALLDEDTEMRAVWQYLQDNMKGVPSEFTLENMKLVWSEILWRVTGYHASIGQVGAWALDPSFNNLRLKPKEVGELTAPAESAIGIALITAITTVPCPTLSQDWNQVFENPDSPAYAKLRTKLDELKKIVEMRNKVRPPNVDFHPEQTALSISS